MGEKATLLHTFARFGAAVFLWSVLAMAATAAETTARSVVEEFHAVLLEVMKGADSLGIDGRYARLEPEISRRFHLPLMISIASGIHWRKADTGQRNALARAFKRFSVGTYASRFSSHSGESFETSSVKPGPRRTRLVHTRINRPAKSPVRISYVLKKFGDAWRIVDVLLDGNISELAVRRSEYRAILRKGGIEALVAILNRKADKLMTE